MGCFGSKIKDQEEQPSESDIRQESDTSEADAVSNTSSEYTLHKTVSGPLGPMPVNPIPVYEADR